MVTQLTEDIINIVVSIPKGRIATYGQVAAMSGHPMAARQVVRVLHTCTKKFDLPWWRVVGSGGKGKGKVKIPDMGGLEQVERLFTEGVKVKEDLTIDMKIFGFVVEKP